MSIKILLLFFTLEIITSNGIAKVGAMRNGRLEYKGIHNEFYKWDCYIGTTNNSLSVHDIPENVENLNKVLQESFGTWTFFWVNGAPQTEEIIYDPAAISAPRPDLIHAGQQLQHVHFNRKVQFSLPDSTTIAGVPFQIRCPYLNTSSKIVISGDFSMLTAFKNANQNMECVTCVTHTPRGAIESGIQSPLFGNVENSLYANGDPTGVSSLTMEIPLRVEMSLENNTFKGFVYLSQSKIKLFVPANLKEIIVNALEKNPTRYGLLVEQGVFSKKTFSVTFYYVVVIPNTDDQHTYATVVAGQEVLISLSFQNMV